MCGILGDINPNGVNRSVFERQLEVIHHRGPDSTGIWHNPNQTVFLGSKRLSIQDLSTNGTMPMKSDDSRYVIVFNGEIYNFKIIKKKLLGLGIKFSSQTDTEVVLKLFIHFGVGFLGHLEGMFALAIFDSLKGELLLARDRMGEKPLYYWEYSEGISFSSQLDQLFLNEKLKRKINLEALDDYLSFGYVNGDKTMIDSVKKLLPGHYMVYSTTTKRSKLNQYWEVPKYRENQFSILDLRDRLDALLGRAVKNQLVADVETGVLLSGGVDSSLITAYASQFSNKKLKTFHISFPGSGRYNESEYAGRVADYFGTEHIALSGNELKYDLLDVITKYTDEPLADSSMMPTFLVSQLTVCHVKSVLGGDGGDELFGGYKKYSNILGLNRKITKYTPPILRSFAAALAGRSKVGLKGRNFLIGLKGDLRQQFTANSLFDEATKRRAINIETIIRHSRIGIPNHGDFIYDATVSDLNNYLPNDILFKVDRASMAHSLEMRAPFLDKSVVEFAFRDVGSHFKVKERQLKILPKLLFQKKLPIEIDINRKQGFSVPLDSWFKGKWYEDVVDSIENFELIFNKNFAFSLLKGIKKGRANASKLYALIMLDKWIKMHRIECFPRT